MRPFKKGVIPLPGLRNGGPKHQLAPGYSLHAWLLICIIISFTTVGVFAYGVCISTEDILMHYHNDLDEAISQLRRKTGLNFVLDEETRVIAQVHFLFV